MADVAFGGRLPTLFGVFFKISAITLGGGLSMIPVMEDEFVRRRGWLSDEDMVDTVALVQSMPGIIAVNMAVMIGYRTARLPGVFAASFGTVFPPFLSILIIASVFRTLSGSEAVSHIFLGVRAAICALILLSAVKMGRQILKHPFPWITAVASFLILTFLPWINAVWVIAAGGVAGLLSIPLGKLRSKPEAQS